MCQSNNAQAEDVEDDEVEGVAIVCMSEHDDVDPNESELGIHEENVDLEGDVGEDEGDFEDCTLGGTSAGIVVLEFVPFSVQRLSLVDKRFLNDDVGIVVGGS